MIEKKYLVYCPFTKRQEYVYLYGLDKPNVFNGCENNYTLRPECTETCKAKALQLYDQECREGPPPHVHIPK